MVLSLSRRSRRPSCTRYHGGTRFGRAASRELIASTRDFLPDAKLAHAGGNVDHGAQRAICPRSPSLGTACRGIRAWRTRPRDRRIGRARECGRHDSLSSRTVRAK